MKTPFVGFSNDNLAQQPHIAAGDKIECPGCGQSHEVEASTPNPPGLLLFYRCPQSGETYLAGVDGRSVMRAKPDVSGSM